MLEMHVELSVWGGAGSEMTSEEGMVAQGGRELQVTSPRVGATVAEVRTENIRLVLGCVWSKTPDAGRGVGSKHPPGQAERCLLRNVRFCSFPLLFSIPYSLYSSPPIHEIC